MISFPSGAAITVYAKKPSGWWKGEYAGEVGYFPGSYVSEKNLKSKKKRPSFVRAIHDYAGESDSEISFQRGDVFVQVDSPADSGWARGTIRDRNGWFPPSFVQPVDTNEGGSRDSFKAGASSNEIEALRSMVITLQQQVHTMKPGPKKGEEGHLLRQLEESEIIRQKQQEQLRSMGTRIESLVIQVNKQNDQISKQQKSIRKLQSSHKSSGSVSDRRATVGGASASVGSVVDKSDEVERLREQLTVEVRQRCDLESIVRKLETQSEILSRQVTRLQRTFEEQTTAAELGPNRLRRTGRDLTH